MVNEGIRVEPAERCFLCGRAGATLYTGFRDRLFDAPGIWNTRTCRECGLLWLDPRPIPDDVGRLYTNYYTHADHPPRLTDTRASLKNAVLAQAFGYQQVGSRVPRVFARVLSAIRPIRDRVGMGIDYLHGAQRGRLLDVGCGSGLFLYRMKLLGWQVAGVDPDPVAARTASERLDVPVATGDVTAVAAGELFDVVTMNHVIEHAVDPIELLRRCARLLKPRGRLVVVTPNALSLGHAVYGRSWMAIEPPRHIFLFNPATLTACIQRAGLTLQTVVTSARSAAATWTTSRQIARSGRGRLDIDSSLAFHPLSLTFQLREEIACARGRDAGEELLLTATA